MNKNGGYIGQLKMREAEARYEKAYAKAQANAQIAAIKATMVKTDREVLESMNFKVIEKFVREKKLKKIKRESE